MKWTCVWLLLFPQEQHAGRGRLAGGGGHAQHRSRLSGQTLPGAAGPLPPPIQHLQQRLRRGPAAHRHRHGAERWDTGDKTGSINQWFLEFVLFWFEFDSALHILPSACCQRVYLFWCIIYIFEAQNIKKTALILIIFFHLMYTDEYAVLYKYVF